MTHSDGRMVTMLPTPCTIADQHVGSSVQRLGPCSVAPDPSATPDAWVRYPSRPTATHDLTPICCSRTMSINSPFTTSQKTQKGSGAPVGFINPGSPMGPLPSKGLAQQTTLHQCTIPRLALIPNDRPEERSNFQSKGLAKEGMTLASDSDPLFRSRIRQTSAYNSSPIDTVGAD